MVSPEITELEQGVVQWKPDPKDMPDTGNGPWKSYQIKVNDKYYDCNQRTYNGVVVDQDIQFTFSTKSFVYKTGDRQGQKGYRYKIASVIGGDQTAPATTESNAQPAPAPVTSGTIGSVVQGPEFGMLYKAAIEECQRIATLAGQEAFTDEDLEKAFLQFFRVSQTLKRKVVEGVWREIKNEPENETPEERQASGDTGGAPAKDESPWGDDGPDPTEPKESPW